jgi:hypothetical protein
LLLPCGMNAFRCSECCAFHVLLGTACCLISLRTELFKVLCGDWLVTAVVTVPLELEAAM